jgi:hypothetical protein
MAGRDGDHPPFLRNHSPEPLYEQPGRPGMPKPDTLQSWRDLPEPNVFSRQARALRK